VGDQLPGLIVKRLILQPQFLGQRFIRGFHQDRSICKDDCWDAAHTSIGCLHELFRFLVSINVDKIILDVVLVQVSPGSSAISAPVGTVHLDEWICQIDAPVGCMSDWGPICGAPQYGEDIQHPKPLCPRTDIHPSSLSGVVKQVYCAIY
jgi:hypothetical protein